LVDVVPVVPGALVGIAFPSPSTQPGFPVKQLPPAATAPHPTPARLLGQGFLLL
jgi:hypothetical protein